MAERKRTNAEIDALNQFLNEGETPLPYEIEDTADTSTTTTSANTSEEKNKTEEEIKAEADAKQKESDDAEAEKIKLAAEAKQKETESAAAQNQESEIDEQKILAYLKNKKGKEITSLDELLNPKKELTEDEKKEALEKREANKYAYGLTNGLFSKTQLENYITDTKNPTELVLDAYKAEQKAKDADLTDEEIEDEFNDKFSLNEEDKESRKYKAGQSLISNLATNLIRSKHAKILNLEKDYSDYEVNQNKQKESEFKIQNQLPLYNKAIEKIGKEIKKISIPISDTEIFEADLDDSEVNDIVTSMMDNSYSTGQIQKEWNEDSLTKIAKTTAILKNLPKLFTAYGEKLLKEKQAGLRGIPPKGKEGERNNAVKELTEDQKKALNFAFNGQEIPAN